MPRRLCSGIRRSNAIGSQSVHSPTAMTRCSPPTTSFATGRSGSRYKVKSNVTGSPVLRNGLAGPCSSARTTLFSTVTGYHEPPDSGTPPNAYGSDVYSENVP